MAEKEVLCYHDNQVFSGRSQGLQGLRFIGGSPVVEGRACDVELPRPVDGPRAVDVIIVRL